MLSSTGSPLSVEDILVTNRPCRAFARHLLAPLVAEESPSTPLSPQAPPRELPSSSSSSSASSSSHAPPPSAPAAEAAQTSNTSPCLSPALLGQSGSPKQPSSPATDHPHRVRAERASRLASGVLEAVRLLVRSVEGQRDALDGAASSPSRGTTPVPLQTSVSTSGALPSPWPSPPPPHSSSGPEGSGGGGGGGGGGFWRHRSASASASASASVWVPFAPVSPSSSVPRSSSLATMTADLHMLAAAPLPVCAHTLLYLLHLLAACTPMTRDADVCARARDAASSGSSLSAEGGPSRVLWLEALKQIALYFTALDRRGLGELVAGVLLFGEPRFSPVWEAQQLNLYSLPPSITEPGERAAFRFYHCHCDGVSEDVDEDADEAGRGFTDDSSNSSSGEASHYLSTGHRRQRPRHRTRRARTALSDTSSLSSSYASSRSSSPATGALSTSSSSSAASPLASSPATARTDISSLSDSHEDAGSPTRRNSTHHAHEALALRPTPFRETSTPLQPSLSFPSLPSHDDGDVRAPVGRLVATSGRGSSSDAPGGGGGGTRARARLTGRYSRHSQTLSKGAPRCPVPPDMLSLSQHFQLVLYRLMDAHGASGHCAPAAMTVRALAHTRAVLMVLLALPLASATSASRAAGGAGSLGGAGAATVPPSSPGYQTPSQHSTQPQTPVPQSHVASVFPPTASPLLAGMSTGTPLSGLLQSPTTTLSASGGAIGGGAGGGVYMNTARSMASVYTPNTATTRRFGNSRGLPSGAASFSNGGGGGSHPRMESNGTEFLVSTGHSFGGGGGIASPLTTATTPFSATYIGHLVPFLKHQTLSICTQSWLTLRQILSQEPALAAPFLLYYMHEVVFDVILAHALLPASAASSRGMTSTASGVGVGGGESVTEAMSVASVASAATSVFAKKRTSVTSPQRVVPPHFIAQQEALSLLGGLLRDTAYLEAQTRYRLSPALLCGVLTLVSSYHDMVLARQAQWCRRQRRLLLRTRTPMTPSSSVWTSPQAQQRLERDVRAAASLNPSPSPSPLAAVRDDQHGASVDDDGDMGMHEEDEEEEDVVEMDAEDDLDDDEDVTSVLDLIPYRHRAAMRLCFEALCEFIVQQDKSTPIRALILMNQELLREFIEIASVLPPILYNHADADTRAVGAAAVLDRQRLLSLLNNTTPLSADERYEMEFA